MNVFLAILLILLFCSGVVATTYSIIHDGMDDYRIFIIGLIGFLVSLGCAFGIGIHIGGVHTVYDFGCKQSPTIVVNRTEYRCTP